MMVFKYDISDIAAQDMECFRDMTAYVSSYIISIDKTENGEMYFNITDGHADEVRRKLDILKNSLSESKYDCSVEEKVFFSTADHQTLNITDGVYAYGGLFLKVYNYFSEYFSKAAREMFGSELLEYKVPVLYPAKEYERGKYFENFPHHIMFQTLIKNDIEVLERFAESCWRRCRCRKMYCAMLLVFLYISGMRIRCANMKALKNTLYQENASVMRIKMCVSF